MKSKTTTGNGVAFALAGRNFSELLRDGPPISRDHDHDPVGPAPHDEPGQPRILMSDVALFTIWNKAIAAEPSDRDWRVVGDRDRVQGWETFSIMNLPNGNVAFKTAHGKWLSAEPEERDWAVRGDRDNIGGWEQFTPELHGEYVAFKTSHGRYVVAEPADRGFVIRADRTVVGGWELFQCGREIVVDHDTGQFLLPLFVRVIVPLIINGLFPARVELDEHEIDRNYRERQWLIEQGHMHDASPADVELASRTA